MTSVLDRHALRSRVQQALEAFVADRRQLLDTIGPELAPLTDALLAYLSGGKRMRPGFCFWGHLGAGGADTDELVVAAASLELFQACAIVHDDVMDGSDTRRGQPAVHRAFAARHREQSWYGDSEAFGAGAAILLGDLALSWADEMLVSSGLATPPALRVFSEMRADVVGGQYLDLLEQARRTGTVEAALRVARYKAAKYTVERPLHLGAAMAGAEPVVLSAYTAYGIPLGEAFQLRDDVLGVFGDPAVTGKPAGDDLREGKRTALVATALEKATPAQAALLDEHLGNPALDEDGVAALRGVLVETRAVERVEALIEARTAEALAALDRAPVTEEAREVLRDLAAAATARA
ncbi:MAG TPA: polyprenyl synthetase family protein, partial [Mycobacteriales bacterium]|nr:polyprenyl synthetase family protein [Mycobacteriales bacterium]